MNMVERYIAAVQRELPEKKREDIGRELNANILDKIEAIEDQQGSISEAEIAGLLKAMGHPRSVALQFCPPTPLISAALMPLYLHTLYMVLGVLLVISVIAITSRWLGGAEMNLFWFLKGLASSFLNDAYFAFAAITIGFAVISRKQKTAPTESPGTCKWSPEKLPAAGKDWQHISLQDIFGDLATMLFLVMLIWYPIWQPDSGATSIFTAEAHSVLLWFTPVIGIAIVHSLWQLRTRLWNRNMLMLNIGVSTAFFLMSLWLIVNTPILRINTEALHASINVSYLELSIQVFVLVIALIAAYEVIRDIRRLVRIS